MDFYEQLKSKVDGKLIEAFEAARRKLALMQKREKDSRQELDRLREQKEKLTDSADISLADSVNAWEKFQVSLKKINSQIEALSDAVTTLSDKIIPEAKREFDRAVGELQKTITGLCAAQAKAVEHEMNELLSQLLNLEDGHHDSVVAIYGDYSLTPPNMNPSIRPHPDIKRVDINFAPRPSVWTFAQEAEQAKAPVQKTLQPTTFEKTVLTGETGTPTPEEMHTVTLLDLEESTATESIVGGENKDAVASESAVEAAKSEGV